MNAVNVLFAVLVVLAFAAQAADEKIVDKVDFTPLGEEGHLQLPTELVHKPVYRARPQRGPGFTLVDGTNTLMIVAPWGNSRGLMPLAKELQYHLEQMSGQKVEVVEPRKRPAKGRFVVIGTDDGKVPEGTSIVRRNGPDELYIGGEGAGVSHAVTYVLEALGCRYLFPGKEGKVIPKRCPVVLPDFELNYTPELKIRLVKLPQVGNRKVNAGLKEKGIEPKDFAKAQGAACIDHPGNRGFWAWHGVNDAGIVAASNPPTANVVRAGHHFTDFWPKYKDTHPEWFALQPDGTRQQTTHCPRLCTANKELRDVIVQECIDRIDRDPKMRGISICMPDGSYDSVCFCELCRGLDPKNAPKKPGFLYKPAKHPFEYVSLTDRMLNFSNYIQSEVRKQRPGKHLVQFVYAGYQRPPLREVPDKDLIFFNVAGNYTDAKRLSWAQENLAAWLSFGNPTVWRPNCLAGFRCPYPMNFGRKLFADIEACKANGAIGVSFDCGNACYASRGFMFYMLAKAVLNPDRLSYKDIAADWVRSGFGPAARPMAEYLLALERVFDAAAERAIGTRGYQEAFDIDSFAAQLDKVEAAAKGDPEIKARVDYLRVGLGYARAAKGVYDGWKTGDWKKLGAARKVYRAWIKEEGLRHAFEFPHDCPYMLGRPYRPNLDGELKEPPAGEGFKEGEADDEGNVVG